MSKTSRQSLVFPLLLLVAAAFVAPPADAAPPQKGKKDFVVRTASDMKFQALAGAPPGPVLSVLWGDPMKGAYGAIEKFPAGFSVPLHTHSSDHKVVVISGTWVHAEEGKADVRVPAGSYLFQPANRKHTTACDSASECVFFIESSGKFDVRMAEAKKAAAN